VTLGCARNEVDSEELAGRLAAGGWDVVAGADSDAENPPAAVLVNTCGFIEAAKQDSIDAVLAASGSDARVVAVGCLAERYGADLADALPEADAVLSFDHYADISARLDEVLAGHRIVAHAPRDRRTLLPISPADRVDASTAVPGHGDTSDEGDGEILSGAGAPASGPRVVRRRLATSPVAPLKLASGCDRRCAFCAIPRFRGAFVSRRPDDLLAEAGWLAGSGVRELYLVSENSTSYGKDLGDLRLLEQVLPELAAVPGIARVRVSYLQPAETRPSLVAAIATTPGVAAYFDLSFQHASEPLLRRMRRFGGRGRFLELIGSVRALAPDAGIRTNVIVGFPGETEHDVEELEAFLDEARLDAVGVFGYSDEDGTEAAGYDGKMDADVIAERVERLAGLADQVTAERAAQRIGSVVEVLVDSIDGDGVEGRAAHQAPEVDGVTTLVGAAHAVPGDLIRARVVGSDGVDLAAEAIPRLEPTGPAARRPSVR